MKRCLLWPLWALRLFFQVINMSPFDIYLKKGDIIGQGIIKRYEITDDDKAEGLRTGGFGSTTDQGIQLLMDLFDAAAATSVPARGMRATAGIYDEAIDTETKGVVEQALKEELNKSLFDACM